jgi:hypothetical protein
MLQFVEEWGYLTYHTPVGILGNVWFDELKKDIKTINGGISIEDYKQISLKMNNMAKNEYYKRKAPKRNKKAVASYITLDSTLFDWMNSPIYSDSLRQWFEYLKFNPIIENSQFLPVRYYIGRDLPVSKLNINDRYDIASYFIVFWNVIRYYSPYPIGEKTNGKTYL